MFFALGSQGSLLKFARIILILKHFPIKLLPEATEGHAEGRWINFMFYLF